MSWTIVLDIVQNKKGDHLYYEKTWKKVKYLQALSQTIKLSTIPDFRKCGAVSQNDKLANSNVAKKRIKGRRMPRAT